MVSGDKTKLRSISLEVKGIARKVFRYRTHFASESKKLTTVFPSQTVYVNFASILIHSYGATVRVRLSTARTVSWVPAGTGGVLGGSVAFQISPRTSTWPMAG